MFIPELFRTKQPRQRNSMNKGSEDGRGIWFGRIRGTGAGEVGSGLGTLLDQGTGIEFWWQ